jgi:catechol 2,3-dioxygenase-like lactoylglutathione lyase family enzyme
MRPQPLIAVADVEATSRWYQEVLGVRSDHGGPDYERLVDGDGRLVMQLHNWDVEHEHGAIGDAGAVAGNGVLLWFEVDDFDDAVARIQQVGAEVVLPPHRNPPEGEPGGPAHREVWIRDPNGYAVVLASPDGESPL